MSVDPWSWGDDNSDQDWNNGWANQDFQQNSKNSGFGGNGGQYPNNNTQQSHHNDRNNAGWNHPRQQHGQINTAADYFNKQPQPPPGANNNPYPDVENKEIPDHASGPRQPMKLGSKQSHHGGSRNDGDHFSNVQQSRHAPPPPDNHSQLPPQPHQGFNHTNRNQPHHYFNNPQKDFFQSNDTNSWNYFNQSGPPSMPPEQSMSNAPSSMPPQHSMNSGPPSMPPQQPMNSGPPSMPPQQPMNSGPPSLLPQQQLHSGPPLISPQLAINSGSQSMPPQQPMNSGPPSMPPQQPMNSGPPSMPPQQPMNSGPPSMPPQQSMNSGPPSMPPQQPMNSGPPSMHPQQPMNSGSPSMPPQQPMNNGPPSLLPQQQLHSGPPLISPQLAINSGSQSMPPQHSINNGPSSMVGHPNMSPQQSGLPPMAMSSGPASMPPQTVPPSMPPMTNSVVSFPQSLGTSEPLQTGSLPPPHLDPQNQPSAANFFLDNHQDQPPKESRSASNYFQMQDQEMENNQVFSNNRREEAVVDHKPDVPVAPEQNPNVEHAQRNEDVQEQITLPEENVQEQGKDNYKKQQFNDKPNNTHDDAQTQSSNRESPMRIPEERTGPQGLADQPERSQGLDRRSMPPPPQSFFSDMDRSQGRKRSGPLAESSEDIFSQERGGSQSRDWPGPFGPDRRGSKGHQRTGSQGSDLSLGRSGSDRSGSSSSRLHQNRPDGSRSSDRDVPRPDRVPSRSPGAGEDRSCPPSRPDNLESLPPESHITQQISQLSKPPNQLDDCPLDRNEYLETSQLSNQDPNQTDTRSSSRHPSDSGPSHNDRREVVGEAEPSSTPVGRVVVGHTTPTNQTPPPNHSDEVEGNGSGSMERMVVGERREHKTNRTNRQQRRHHHRRESSYEEDDQEYSSDNRRHRDDYRRDHRNKRLQEHRSSDYLSDEDYEIDRRAYSRRDRRVRDRDYEPRDRDYEPRDRDYEPRDRDYEPRDREYEPRDRDQFESDYRRDYYRDDHRRGGRGRDERYYRYEDDDYTREYNQRSRPSSRSGSDYRRTNLDYQSRNQSRHYFNPALAGVLSGREYEANPEYFEMLRKSNPVLYAIWYQDYMRKLQDTATHFTQSDRASIHSGQSSGNRINLSTPNQGLESNVGATESFDDYSPRLFSTPHVRGCYDNLGRLILVNACSPLDGQQASVQLLSVEPDDPAVKLFLDSPGPFIPGVTHKSTVLQYLRKQSDQAAKGSEKLLYDLVHLIVKSNGKPDGLDISELLLESYNNSKGDNRDGWEAEEDIKPISHEDMLKTFRHLLHQGNKQEALDWAMKHGGWGHAFFLSSKMDIRTQTRVASEFTRALAPSDPLSTLYQIMSDGVPSSATACIDKRWSDWRPHLAIVLSNLTDNSMTNLSTVTTLADGLASRGRTYAAHTCYLIAQVMFGDLYKSEGPVLLGWSEPSIHSSQSLSQPRVETFNYKSFLLSLCYEYGVKQSQPNFFIPALQRYKLMIACRLAEWGRGRQGLLYCELLSSEILHSIANTSTGGFNTDLLHLLIELAMSLKSLDPIALNSIDIAATPDPEWLQQIKHLASTLPQEEFEPSMIPQSQHEPAISNFEAPGHVPMYRRGNSMERAFANGLRIDDGPSILTQDTTMEPPTSTSTPSKPSDQSMIPTIQQPMIPPMQQPMHPPLQQPMQQMQPPMQQPMQPPMQQPMQQPNSLPPMNNQNTFQPSFASQPLSFSGYEDSGASEVDNGVIKPAVWEPEKPVDQPSTQPKSNFFHQSENLLQGLDGNKAAGKPPPPPSQPSKPDASKKQNNQANATASSGGWLGGLFGKLSMKPKNEMILPDDKDPKIVFDPKLNKWVDKENEGTEAAKELKPPPIGGPTMPTGGPTMPGPGIPPGNPGMPMAPGIPQGMPAPGSNMTNKYKLQKGKSMKSNYVDILSNSGVSSKVSGSMEPLMAPMAPLSQQDQNNSNYFQPNSDTSHQGDGNFQGQNAGVPMFYNPANFKS